MIHIRLHWDPYYSCHKDKHCPKATQNEGFCPKELTKEIQYFNKHLEMEAVMQYFHNNFTIGKTNLNIILNAEWKPEPSLLRTSRESRKWTLWKKNENTYHCIWKLLVKPVQIFLELILSPMLLHQRIENAHSYLCKQGKKLQNNQTTTLTLYKEL